MVRQPFDLQGRASVSYPGFSIGLRSASAISAVSSVNPTTDSLYPSFNPTTKEIKMPSDRDRLKKANWITILNDDETYTSLGGCHIAIPTAAQLEELDEGSDPNDLEGLESYDLRALLDWAISNGYFDQNAATEPGKE
jgi:hypothetical protein